MNFGNCLNNLFSLSCQQTYNSLYLLYSFSLPLNVYICDCNASLTKFNLHGHVTQTMRLSTSNFAHVLKTKIKQNIVSKVLHFLDLSQLPLRALTAASKTLIKCILVVQVGQSQTEDYHRQKSGATLLNLGRHREKMKALRSNFRYITTKQTGPAWQEIREDYGRKRNEEKAFAFYSVLPPILFQS